MEVRFTDLLIGQLRVLLDAASIDFDEQMNILGDLSDAQLQWVIEHCKIPENLKLAIDCELVQRIGFYDLTRKLEIYRKNSDSEVRGRFERHYSTIENYANIDLWILAHMLCFSSVVYTRLKCLRVLLKKIAKKNNSIYAFIACNSNEETIARYFYEEIDKDALIISELMDLCFTDRGCSKLLQQHICASSTNKNDFVDLYLEIVLKGYSEHTHLALDKYLSTYKEKYVAGYKFENILNLNNQTVNERIVNYLLSNYTEKHIDFDLWMVLANNRVNDHLKEEVLQKLIPKFIKNRFLVQKFLIHFSHFIEEDGSDLKPLWFRRLYNAVFPEIKSIDFIQYPNLPIEKYEL